MIPHTTLRVAEPPLEVDYWCANGHHTPRIWSTQVATPDLWECRHCGLPAGRDRAHPPRLVAVPPFKTPLAYLFERRSEVECAALLDEALERLHSRRRCTEPGGCSSGARS
ncbi:RNA polymerase-binding protein RbpA [Pseudonocardia sp. KRD291]|uniref:RNA polymerase-binding protein RbpA n=1 Tax=Pseudonocardia sp. KRD291 TaxID=2792007 RepID=UPI001C4A5B58|nr:RNA polymerase-binding protein RbpA [Pseudonocardia sp. KRD291]MBW0101809.1 RNA polymerase-binding protein RbpA [Pseudonocardia sp. KRD291]